MLHSLSVCSSFIAVTLGHALIPMPHALESRVSRKHWKTQEEQVAADNTPPYGCAGRALLWPAGKPLRVR